MQPLHRPRQASGFVLVELLVSLLVLGMAAEMLLASFVMTRRIVAQASATATQTDTIATTQNILRHHIEQIVAATRYDVVTPAVDFSGTSENIDFVAPAALVDQPSTVMHYRLELSANGKLQLYRLSDLSVRYEPDSTSTFGWISTPLLDGVATIDISYFGNEGSDKTSRWRASWVGRSEPPELIRIRLVFRPGDQRAWPELIIRPVATVSSACRIDSSTGHCAGGS